MRVKLLEDHSLNGSTRKSGYRMANVQVNFFEQPQKGFVDKSLIAYGENRCGLGENMYVGDELANFRCVATS